MDFSWLLNGGWLILLYVLFGFIGGAIVGYFIARFFLKREVRKNPPINEKMIRVLFQQMGQKPSEARIKQIVASMNQYR